MRSVIKSRRRSRSKPTGPQVLIEYEGNYQLGTGGPLLHYQGGLVTVGQFGSWSPIAAEATAGGYEIAWKSGGADLYEVWNTNSNGNFLSYLLNVSTGENTALELLEPSFQDLNGDGTTGIPLITIESFGSTRLRPLPGTSTAESGWR